MSFAVLTPFTGARAQQAGTRWRKRLLPIDSINYKGRTLDFTRDYLAGLVQAFKQRAYDQVPFQLAPGDNSHTNDPERTVGQITDMTLGDDGLWIEVEPTERGKAVLTANPGLGVSARIVEGYQRSDGQSFAKAIQHVLGTLDPRIPGLGGWSAVEAANDVDITVDLSGEAFAGKEPGMPELDEAQQQRLAALLNLDPAKLARLAESLPEGGAPDPATLNGGEGTPPGDGGEGAPDEMDELVAWLETAPDDEVEAWMATLEAGDGEGVPEPAGAGLAGQDRYAVELAQATGDENARQLGIIMGQLDNERWVNERRKLVAAGVPPYVADLAQPLLEGAGHVVDLANGTSVDAGQIMRAVLGEYAKMSGSLELGAELGTALDLAGDQEDEATKARREVVDRAKVQLGLV